MSHHLAFQRESLRQREGVAAGVAAVLAAYLIALGFLGEPRPSATATTLIAKEKGAVARLR